MLTGDAGQSSFIWKGLSKSDIYAVAIAKELGRQLKLGTNVYDSERLMSGTMSGSDVSHIQFVAQHRSKLVWPFRFATSLR